jgi:hypothetical protein
VTEASRRWPTNTSFGPSMCPLGQRAGGWIITEPAGWMRADGDNLMWPWCLHTTNPDHLMPSRPSLTDASTNNIVKLTVKAYSAGCRKAECAAEGDQLGHRRVGRVTNLPESRPEIATSRRNAVEEPGVAAAPVPANIVRARRGSQLDSSLPAARRHHHPLPQAPRDSGGYRRRHEQQGLSLKTIHSRTDCTQPRMRTVRSNPSLPRWIADRSVEQVLTQITFVAQWHLRQPLPTSDAEHIRHRDQHALASTAWICAFSPDRIATSLAR